MELFWSSELKTEKPLNSLQASVSKSENEKVDRSGSPISMLVSALMTTGLALILFALLLRVIVRRISNSRRIPARYIVCYFLVCLMAMTSVTLFFHPDLDSINTPATSAFFDAMVKRSQQLAAKTVLPMGTPAVPEDQSRPLSAKASVTQDLDTSEMAVLLFGKSRSSAATAELSRPSDTSLPSLLDEDSSSGSRYDSSTEASAPSSSTTARPAPSGAHSTEGMARRSTWFYLVIPLSIVTICTSAMTVIFASRTGLLGRRPQEWSIRILEALCCGRARYLSLRRARQLDGLVLQRNGFDQDADDPPPAPGAPANPAPLVQVNHRLCGPYTIHVSLALKAQGLGSAGLDTPDNRRIAYLRACEIMQKRGVRSSHIAKSAPMAVALSFIPLPEEVAAAQMPITLESQELLEARSRQWIDPRVDGHVEPSMAYN